MSPKEIVAAAWRGSVRCSSLLAYPAPFTAIDVLSNFHAGNVSVSPSHVHSRSSRTSSDRFSRTVDRAFSSRPCARFGGDGLRALLDECSEQVIERMSQRHDPVGYDSG